MANLTVEQIEEGLLGSAGCACNACAEAHRIGQQALSELRDLKTPCVWRFFPSTSTIPAYHAPQCGGEGWRDRTDHIKFCPNCQRPVKVEEPK